MSKTKRKTGTVCFQVEGAFVVNIARERAVWEDYRLGQRMLVNSFEGMTLDIADQILRGEKTLSGFNSDIELVDEDKEVQAELLADYRKRYGYLLYHNNKFYKPEYRLRPGPQCVFYVSTQLREIDSARLACTTPEMTATYWFTASELNRAIITSHMSIQTLKAKIDQFLVVWREESITVPHWFEETTNADQLIRDMIANDRIEIVRVLEDIDGLDVNRDLEVAVQGVPYERLSAVETFLNNPSPKDVKERSMEISRIRHKVWEQNGEDDYIIMLGQYKVPTKPLKNWALRNSEGKHLAPKWDPVSSTGWKMFGDDPNHTDWVIGAGIDPELLYTKYKDLNDEASEWRFNYEHEVTGAELSRLSVERMSEVTDVVQHVSTDSKVNSLIVYIPDCSTAWISIARQVGKQGGIILTKTGGQLSHLVMKSEEYGITILMHPQADTLFPDGCRVKIDPDSGTYNFPMISAEKIMRRALFGGEE